ncbi:SDR family oxidoreductase [Aestuariibacter sp. GS-14]|uniref:SDR family oxidoreductase n=1 Tax=Aestuariibacter sp. GS-14 TaxID=2590670 RepID=UPI00112E68D7|nr:SDR family oxidoreductase [Aestuariibacter sp. GS-14]TPV54322.1 SDR family oxidoreductase [Aestuariibacter sp. GS-14]
MTKVVLITGTSTGFGRDTANTLAKEGFAVFAAMRDITGKNKQHADSLRNSGIQVVELDVTNVHSVNQAVDEVLRQAGRIDVLINNAGVAYAGVSEAFTDEQVQQLFDVNVIGVHRVSRAVLPIMRVRGTGLIINIGSILGRVTFPFFGLYGATKFALEAITDSLRYELSPLGIDVALIQPSAYPTQMYASVSQPNDSARANDYGQVGEIPSSMFASFMAMFASDNAPDPHDVAESILQLVQTPHGQRPDRTVVGEGFGANQVNDAVSSIQSATIKALGLQQLEPKHAASQG